MNNSNQHFHVICERDVGLFSLVQQVIANIPWALAENRIPVALFRHRCCYFSPEGYRDATNVWEYYFEPLFPEYPADCIDEALIDTIDATFPGMKDKGSACGLHFFTAHFGDHPELEGLTLEIPYLWDDPDRTIREVASKIISNYVRPRKYIENKAEAFRKEHLADGPVIGVHVRGTDAVSIFERRAHRQGSLSWRQYISTLRGLLDQYPGCKVFVASDSEKAVQVLNEEFGGLHRGLRGTQTPTRCKCRIWT